MNYVLYYFSLWNYISTWSIKTYLYYFIGLNMTAYFSVTLLVMCFWQVLYFNFLNYHILVCFLFDILTYIGAYILFPLHFIWKLNSVMNEFCQVTMEDSKPVTCCPTSKEEWFKAAHKRNCSAFAVRNNCTIGDEIFYYHCVINGFSNETLEVCAPKKIIFGKKNSSNASIWYRLCK